MNHPPAGLVRPQYDEAAFAMAANHVCPGPDLEWFAVDTHFFVAGFTNAGFAKVPTSVFQSFQLFNATLDAISALPRTGGAVTVRPAGGHTWERWSEHGLFAYDWDHAIGHPDSALPYRLISCPEEPIHLSAFPREVATYLLQFQFKHLSFRDAYELVVE